VLRPPVLFPGRSVYSWPGTPTVPGFAPVYASCLRKAIFESFSLARGLTLHYNRRGGFENSLRTDLRPHISITATL